MSTFTAESRFIVFAIRKAEPTALLQLNLSFQRLVEDILTPYDEGEPFFIDGAPVKASDLDRIKVLLEGPLFDRHFKDLSWTIHAGDLKARELHTRNYNAFLENLIRTYTEDVTSQVFSAYKTVIKPRLRDYLPKREELLNLGITFLAEASVKAFQNSPIANLKTLE
jgi:hypothetical protein